MDNPLPTYQPDSDFQEINPELFQQLRHPNRPDWKTILKHVALFLVTFVCVSFAGASFVGFNLPAFPLSWPSWHDFVRGALFASLLLSFLGIHEFGHYFTAVYHKVRVTLPYFIPLPIGIGTMGAVIRIRQKLTHSYKMFDIGIAGPIAGFVVSLAVLIYGFATLPNPLYIINFQGHEALKQFVETYGHFPSHPISHLNGETIIIGNTLLYHFLASFFHNVPPMWEMYHYPFLFAGWLGLFFTALNLTPVGQLDGGHILYALIGYKKHRLVARIFFAILVTLAGIQAVPFIHIALGQWDTAYGSLSWIIWAILLFSILRRAFRKNHRWIAPVLIGSLILSAAYLYLVLNSVNTPGSLIWVFWSFFIGIIVKIEHPPAQYEAPLSLGRKILGWSSMAIFILCISPNPISLI